MGPIGPIGPYKGPLGPYNGLLGPKNMFWGCWTFVGVFFWFQKLRLLQKMNFGKVDLNSADLHELIST